jgi:copper ion binding protein
MAEQRATVRVDVDGMSCGNCERKIEKAVGALDGVSEVAASAALSEVNVAFDPERTSLEAVKEAIRGAGYAVRGEQPAAEKAVAPPSGAKAGACSEEPQRRASPDPKRGSVYRFLGLIAVIAAIYFIIRYTVGFTFLPTVTQSMGYGLIFVVGLITSLHCIAMCGGIALSQGMTAAGEPSGTGTKTARLVPSLLYNAGRVLSYTIIGGVVGAVGSLFSLSTALKGVMPIVAGAFMLFLGVRMLGIFPWLSRLKIRIPGLSSERIRGNTAAQRASAAAFRRGPFAVGLLNGLMPCGPLQTMQVYALGTGSFLAGALSMFLFSLGTVPLLLGFGAISSLLSAKFNRRMLKASGVLVMALGLLMFSRGLNLFGVSLPAMAPRSGVAVAKVAGNYQEVSTTVESGEYHPFVVQAGIPVRWTIAVKAEDLNGCNNPLTIPSYGIKKQLVAGKNVIEFTPERTGTITYTCWMGMISSRITVVPDLAKLTAADLKGLDAKQTAGGDIASAFEGDDSRTSAGSEGDAARPRSQGCCCGSISGKFAGGRVPTDLIVPARFEAGGQVAEVKVDDNGYSPAVIVLQKGVKAKIRFLPANLSGCNSVVVFPEYNGALDLSQRQLETPYLEISKDFTFQCGMGMLHGYVKVVDDIASFDVKAVRRQIDAYRPSLTGGGCRGN